MPPPPPQIREKRDSKSATLKWLAKIVDLKKSKFIKSKEIHPLPEDQISVFQKLIESYLYSGVSALIQHPVHTGFWKVPLLHVLRADDGGIQCTPPPRPPTRADGHRRLRRERVQRKGSGKWREAKRRRPLQTATPPRARPPPPALLTPHFSLPLPPPPQGPHCPGPEGPFPRTAHRSVPRPVHGKRLELLWRSQMGNGRGTSMDHAMPDTTRGTGTTRPLRRQNDEGPEKRTGTHKNTHMWSTERTLRPRDGDTWHSPSSTTAGVEAGRGRQRLLRPTQTDLRHVPAAHTHYRPQSFASDGVYPEGVGV